MGNLTQDIGDSNARKDKNGEKSDSRESDGILKGAEEETLRL